MSAASGPPSLTVRSARPGWQPDVDRLRCTGCGWCVAACPPHVLSLSVAQGRKAADLHAPAQCTGCSDCAVVCPFRAIRMRRGVQPQA